jgi:hypothetical protein
MAADHGYPLPPVDEHLMLLVFWADFRSTAALSTEHRKP